MEAGWWRPKVCEALGNVYAKSVCRQVSRLHRVCSKECSRVKKGLDAAVCADNPKNGRLMEMMEMGWQGMYR